MGKQSKRARRRQQEDQRKKNLSMARQREKQHKEDFSSLSKHKLDNANLYKEKYFPAIVEEIIAGRYLPLSAKHPLFSLSRAGIGGNATRNSLAARLLRHIAKVRPQLFGAICQENGGDLRGTYAAALTRLLPSLQYSIRPPEDWKPKGRSAHRNFRTLIEHLFIKYPTHPALFHALLDEHAESTFTKLYFALGKGQSLRSLELPIPLTKKMCHLFHQAPRNLTVVQVFRWAQCASFGASHALRHALLHSYLGENIMPDEDFWLTVTQWMTTHWDGPIHQVGPVIDYIRSMKEQDPAYTMKGRTSSSMLRQMRDWHRMLGVARHITWSAIPASGLKPFAYRDEENNKTWQIQELRNSIELFQEGHKQGHCVYSYLHATQGGGTSIWSMTYTNQKLPKRALTIEVRNHQRTIVQVRGKSNRPARKHERALIHQWALENGLEERYY